MPHGGRKREPESEIVVVLPSGDAALTRRARKVSGLSAVVVRFGRARKRYERQGTLVEQEALERAEAECLADADARARRRHAGARGSGRVGRSAAGRAFDPGALRLAVAASVRHRDTVYDELLMSGVDRAEARLLVDDGRKVDSRLTGVQPPRRQPIRQAKK